MATTIQQIELPKKARALDTSGNNNHGQIYSGRGLEFDGVSDHLLTGYGDGLNPYTTPITVAIWVKTAAADGKIFIGPTAGTNQRFYIGHTGGVWDMGIQDSIWNSTTNEVSGFSDQPSYEVDTWYRIVIVMSAGQATMYVNGVKSYAKTYTSYVFDSDITIGSFGDNTSYYWDGMLSDAQIWDAAFTQADVTYDYLNPESLALNNSGTALTESNLKLWYPMQDGHRGQQSYILDGANSGLVDEKVTDGNFPSGTTAWTSDASTVFAEGSVTLTGGGDYKNLLVQTNVLESGKLYKVTYTCDLSSVISGSLKLQSFSDGSVSRTVLDGTNTIYLTANATTFYVGEGGMSGTATLSNVSVKPVNDKNHATTVFHGDELVTNGTFASGTTGWDKNTNTTLSVTSEQLDIQSGGGSGVYGYAYSTVNFVQGRAYKIDLDVISTNVASHIRAGSTSSLAGVPTNIWNSGDIGVGSQSITFVAATNATYFAIGGRNDMTTLVIDNVSIKEVGVASGWTDADQQLHIPQTALQSYNELAWFDGEGDYIDINPSTAIWNGSDGEWNSVSCWVNETGLDSAIFYWSAGFNPGLYVKIDGSNHLIGYNTGNGEQFGITIASTSIINKWNHWVMNFKRNSNSDDTAISGSDVELFLNGVKQTLSYVSGSNSNSCDTSTTQNIELMSHGAYYFTTGVMTEVSTWKDQLSDAEVLELFNDGKALDALTHSNANLSAYWRNNGLSTWTNLVNSGTNDGTPTNVTETILIPQGVDSSRDNQGFIMNKQKDTSCLNLTNGSDDPHVDLGSVATVADDEAFSFVVWLKPDDFTANYFMGTSSTDYISVNSSTTLAMRADNATAVLFTVDTIVPKEWIHVAVVKKASNDLVTIYINGDASVDTETLNEPFDYRYLGSQYTSKSFRGAVDGFLVYNSELDETEVTRNYNATKGSHRN